jgi:hypothetical protein
VTADDARRRDRDGTDVHARPGDADAGTKHSGASAPEPSLVIRVARSMADAAADDGGRERMPAADPAADNPPGASQPDGAVTNGARHSPDAGPPRRDR